MPVFFFDGLPFYAVEEPADLIFGPLDAIDVKVFGGVLFGEFVDGSFEGVVGPLATEMEGAEGTVDVGAVRFDDVDFASGGPGSVGGIGGEHPGGGPDALTTRHLGANFKFAVFPVAAIHRADAGGGVGLNFPVNGGEVFAEEFELEFSVGDHGVFRGVGVILAFVVAAAVAVDFLSPLGAVERVAVEFIAPDRDPLVFEFVEADLGVGRKGVGLFNVLTRSNDGIADG